MGFAVDGIVSGMDTSSLISAMVSVYSLPRDQLEQDIDDTEEKVEAVSGLKNRLEDLEEALDAIEDEDDFKVFKATYSDTEAFTATANGEAISGAYDIEITALARAELEVSEGFSSKSTSGLFGSGTLSITYAGDTSEVTVDSDASLSDVASSIDAIDGLRAYVLDTGSDTDPFKLVVQGEDTGADNTISFSTSSWTGSEIEFTENRTAQDASLLVNGIKVTNETNTINDSVPGLDIELFQTTSSAKEVTVALDREGIRANVQAVLDAHGEVVDWVSSKSSFNSDAGIKGPFVGETTVTRVMRSLQKVISSTYSAGETLDSLTVMGIKTQSTGKLSLDASTFDDALDDYLDDVVGMFTGEDGFGAAMKDQIDVYIDPVDGTLVSFKDSLEERIGNMEDQVASYEYRIERYENRLRAQFSSMEAMLGSMQGTSSYLNAYLTNKS